MLLEEIKNKFKIYVDMDGVLADFEKGFAKLSNGDGKKQESMTKEEVWNLINSEKPDTFYSDLEKMPDADELWNFIKKYKPEILSSTGNSNEQSRAEQKRLWVQQYFGDNIATNFVNKSALKAKYATPNSILIDDRKKSIDPWIEAGGIGILHKSAKDTIKQLKKILNIK